MNKKNFTLEDVERMLEEIGFKWVDRLVFNPDKERYKELKNNTFNTKKPLFLSVKNLINGFRSLALVEVDNNTFVLRINDNKIDASKVWVELQQSMKAEV